jgi:hypothetical protein
MKAVANSLILLTVLLCGCRHLGNGQSVARALRVEQPPAAMELPEFYQKYVSANGFPVLGSAKVRDAAMLEAAFIVNMLLAQRPDVRQAMIDNGSRLVVMAYTEFTSDVPEHSRLKPNDWWDRRARGLGGSEKDPVASCAEENLLCFPGDPYHAENILIHEFAHLIHLRGVKVVDKTFDRRLGETYKAAMKKGLWKGKYAAQNSREYFAEGVQSWFNNNRPPDHDHNHVDTRAELLEYDPGLAALCKEVFGQTEFRYVRPPDREVQAHLAGYDYSTSPTFEWPERLNTVNSRKRPKK